jgi:hypothetical protein
MGRHLLLLAFCLTTYAIAPVAGFGWLLAILGLSQCPDEWRALRSAYVVIFAFITIIAEADLLRIFAR